MAKNEKKSKKDRSGPRPWRDTSVFAGGPGQKWTGVASVLLLTVLVGGSLGVLFWPKSDTTAMPTVHSSTAPSASAAAAASSACPEAAIDEGQTAVPADLQWTAQYGNSWPTSPEVGPTKKVDGVSQCFARSPIGAALAAVGAAQSLRTADVPTAHRILDAQYVQNPGAVALGSSIDKAYSAMPPLSRSYGRVIGFRMISFTPDEATLLLVESWPQKGQYTGYPVTVVWEDGDWKIRLFPNGMPYEHDYDQITVDPTGFTRWEATP